MRNNSKKKKISIFCEFDYCIYNKKHQCLLKAISVSPLGMCDDCILPNIDDTVLEEYKQATIERLEQTVNIT